MTEVIESMYEETNQKIFALKQKVLSQPDLVTELRSPDLLPSEGVSHLHHYWDFFQK